MVEKILLGLTTTPGSDWQEKIKEIDHLGLKEVALFPTYLRPDERRELYYKLEQTKLQSIPHVHLRDDMEKWELELFWDRYGTRLFNVHARVTDEKFINEVAADYKKNIFIENGAVLDERFFELAKKCGGFCFDVSHYHDFAEIQGDGGYRKLLDHFKKGSVGCCHISAVAKKSGAFFDLISGRSLKGYSFHLLRQSQEIDYVEKYVDYLPEIISIELENSFEEQLEIVERLKEIISYDSF